MEKEAEHVVRENVQLAHPAKSSTDGEFAEYILADLIAQGFSGDKPLEEFKNKQAKVRPAVEAMIADADEVANGNGEYATYDDVFNAENDEQFT